MGAQKEVLRQLMKNNQVEIALRLNGDPILPLVYDMKEVSSYLPRADFLPTHAVSWTQDVAGLIIRSRLACKDALGELPSGFVPGGGALTLSLAELLRRFEYQWTIGGFPETEWTPGESTYLRSGNDHIHVFSPHELSYFFYKGSDFNAHFTAGKMFERISSLDPEECPVAVFDLAHSNIPLKDFLDEWVLEQSRAKNVSMVLVKEIDVEEKLSSTEILQIWPYSWSWVKGFGSPNGPGLLAWIGDPEKNTLWENLYKTRQTIDQYQNSGKAAVAVLDRILDQFYTAWNGSFFEWSGRTELDIDIPLKTQKAQAFKSIIDKIASDLSVLTNPSAMEVGRSSIAAVSNINNSPVPKFENISHMLLWSVPKIPGSIDTIRIDRFSV